MPALKYKDPSDGLWKEIPSYATSPMYRTYTSYAVLAADWPTAPEGALAFASDTFITYRRQSGTWVPDVTAWQVPTLLGAWVNFLAGYAPVAYRLENFGKTGRVRGTVKTGALSSAIFVLAAGYRPTAGTVMIDTIANGAVGRLDIDTAGQVVFAVGNNAYVSLDFTYPVF